MASARPDRKNHTSPCVPSGDSIVGGVHDHIDYRDAFMVADHGFDTVTDFATAYFLNQPRWLSALSMNLLSRERLTKAIGDRSYQSGSAVGSWKVQARNEREIVFGDDMGFMRYCFSFRMHADGEVEASTVVAYRWPRMSRFYFGLVKPLHRRFVPYSLRAVHAPNGSLVHS